MQYRASMPKLLKEVGWTVMSDEFAEIEDPDPENHERRQRELINEIEEARKHLEEEPEEKRNKFAFWKRTKKAPQKKAWETYDDRLKEPIDGNKPESGPNGHNGGVLFDVDAIRREVAEISAEGIEVKQLESTLPPMKLSMAESSQASAPSDSLRKTKSYNDSVPAAARTDGSLDLEPPDTGHRPHNPFTYDYNEIEYGYRRSGDGDDGVTMSFDTPSSKPSTGQHNHAPSSESSTTQNGWAAPASAPAQIEQRPPFNHSYTMPAAKAPANPDQNVWADEEDENFGKEAEMTMTFA